VSIIGPYKNIEYNQYVAHSQKTKSDRLPRSKTDLVLAAISRFVGEFTVSQLEQACPGVSKDMIRRVLREQQSVKVIECQGCGPAARWKKKG